MVETEVGFQAKRTRRFKIPLGDVGCKGVWHLSERRRGIRIDEVVRLVECASTGFDSKSCSADPD